MAKPDLFAQRSGFAAARVVCLCLDGCIIFFKGAKVIISLASQPTSEVGWLGD